MEVRRDGRDDPDPACPGGTATGGGCGHYSLHIGKLPKLVIAGIDSILLHEEPDPGRFNRLREMIEASGCLRNPLIAASDHGTASHILLDGVNRFEALTHLGARHVLIQEVELGDDSLRLSTWHHAVEGLDASRVVADLEESLHVTPHQGEFTTDGDFIPHFDDDQACLIVLADRSCYAVCAERTARHRVEVIRKVVGRIISARNLDRVSYTNMADLTDHYPDFSALVCYRPFSKHEVSVLSIDGIRFPSGVTRFGVPKRALSFEVGLDLLRDEAALQTKQTRLEKMIAEKIKAKKIRFYEEPTFDFDD